MLRWKDIIMEVNDESSIDIIEFLKKIILYPEQFIAL